MSHRVKALAEMEMELGFRSSFNFVPEGEYSVPSELRSWLTERGFEVGIHDLRHDGKLYTSRKAFHRSAARINSDLKEWNAVGFRSAFMLHNLEWIGDLDVCYDASTFDTDPFEPQPDGANTIFPFWVALRPSTLNCRPSTLDYPRSGYVELPYTLPQDSTMFLFLEEKSNEIWKKKLDWIAWKGGMALVDVHPDYFSFSGVVRNGEEFPARHYRDILVYLKDRHAEALWHPRQRSLRNGIRAPSAFVDGSRPLPKSRRTRYPRRIVKGSSASGRPFFSTSEYPGDPRPRRAAEALTDAGMNVDLMCLRQKEGQPEHEIVNGVNVFRVPWRHQRGGNSPTCFSMGDSSFPLSHS